MNAEIVTGLKIRIFMIFAVEGRAYTNDRHWFNNALAQIRDALYEISDTLKEVKETEDIVNKCENCPYKTYYEQGYV